MDALISNRAVESHDADDSSVVVRPAADFSPSIWGDYFISHSAPWPSLVLQYPNSRIEKLKMEVKKKFKSSNELTKTLLELIDELQHLGIAYHFEDEINEALKRINEQNNEEVDDLKSVALCFRLLREYGYDIFSGVFNKFKDSKGKFNEDTVSNVEGLLCLYEAGYLSKRKEGIFDEAIKFAKFHMEHLMEHVNNALSAQIQRSLDIPFYQGIRRINARHYISDNEKGEANSNIMLELAKLDFNYVQSLHLAEIRTISVWWRELGLVEKLSFARDRLVECFFWSLAVQDEPQYSQGRILLTKIIALASVMDDMFDAYGTIEELQLFANVIQSWNFQKVDQLPEYMRIFLDAFISLVEEIENELIKNGRFHYKQYYIESIKIWVGSYFKEAQWVNNKYMPALEEYLHISITSSCIPMFICASLILTGEELSHDLLCLVVTQPKVIKASALIGRVMDDLASTEFEQQREHVPSSVQCYMNNYGVKKEEACIQLTKMVANAWKEINEESLKNGPSQKHLNMLSLNNARASRVTYNNGDGFTHSSGDMKENLSLLLLHPIGNMK